MRIFIHWFQKKPSRAIVESDDDESLTEVAFGPDKVDVLAFADKFGDDDKAYMLSAGTEDIKVFLLKNGVTCHLVDSHDLIAFSKANGHMKDTGKRLPRTKISEVLHDAADKVPTIFNVDSGRELYVSACESAYATFLLMQDLRKASDQRLGKARDRLETLRMVAPRPEIIDGLIREMLLAEADLDKFKKVEVEAQKVAGEMQANVDWAARMAWPDFCGPVTKAGIVYAIGNREFPTPGHMKKYTGWALIQSKDGKWIAHTRQNIEKGKPYRISKGGKQVLFKWFLTLERQMIKAASAHKRKLAVKAALRDDNHTMTEDEIKEIKVKQDEALYMTAREELDVKPFVKVYLDYLAFEVAKLGHRAEIDMGAYSADQSTRVNRFDFPELRETVINSGLEDDVRFAVLGHARKTAIRKTISAFINVLWYERRLAMGRPTHIRDGFFEKFVERIKRDYGWDNGVPLAEPKSTDSRPPTPADEAIPAFRQPV